MTEILLGNCQNNHQCFSGPVGPAQIGSVGLCDGCSTHQPRCSAGHIGTELHHADGYCPFGKTFDPSLTFPTMPEPASCI